jgi:hypothetical protein
MLQAERWRLGPLDRVNLNITGRADSWDSSAQEEAQLRRYDRRRHPYLRLVTVLDRGVAVPDIIKLMRKRGCIIGACA